MSGTRPGVPSATDLAQRQLDAYNAGDGDRFAACYAEDVVVARLPAGEEILRGRAALRAHYGALFAREPLLRAELLSRIPCGAFVVDHERVTTGPDRPARRAVAIYEARDGLIARVWFPPVEEEEPPPPPAPPPATTP